jgi:hypothetical protein
LRHKTEVIQSRKANVDRQHHAQDELIDGHRSRYAPDGQGFFHQFLESQFLQQGGYR